MLYSETELRALAARGHSLTADQALGRPMSQRRALEPHRRNRRTTAPRGNTPRHCRYTCHPADLSYCLCAASDLYGVPVAANNAQASFSEDMFENGLPRCRGGWSRDMDAVRAVRPFVVSDEARSLRFSVYTIDNPHRPRVCTRHNSLPALLD